MSRSVGGRRDSRYFTSSGRERRRESMTTAATTSTPIRPTTPARATFCEGLCAGGVTVMVTGHVTTPPSSYSCSASRSTFLGSASALRVNLKSTCLRAASDPPVQRAVEPSTDSIQPAAGCTCSISSPDGTLTTKLVIGSVRSFGTSRMSDSDPLLGMYVGIATTCADARPGSPSASAALQTEMASDDHPLHLIRALADLEDLLVAVETLDGRLLHVAEAAVDLESRVRDPVRELAGEELRHRGLTRERPALVLEPRGLVDERAAGLDLRRHVRELEADRLERGDRLAELLALLRVCEREVVRALREPDAHGGDRDPPSIEDLEELLETGTACAEEVPLGHGTVLERELARVRCTPAELLHGRRDDVAGRPVLDDDVRDLVVAGPRRDRHSPRDVGPGVRDEELRARYDPRAVPKLRARARRSSVGARIGLRQTERGELPAGGEVGKPALLLLPGAVQEDRHRPERRVRRERDGHRRVDTGELLHGDRVRDRVAARAAVLLRNEEAQEAELPELGHEVVGERAAQVELRGDGLDPLQRERSDGLADQLLLGGEVEVHAARMVAAR